MKLFWQGFRAIIPLWAGVVPFGMAYAVLARSSGLSLWETQLMSVIVFAGSSQFSAAGLFGLGASSLSIILTTFVINMRHFLYTLTLGQAMNLSWSQKLIAAHLTTDEAFGVTLAHKQLNFPFFMGTALSLFLSWNVSTLAGSLLSEAVPDPEALGIDFIFPIAFLALLIPLLKTRKDLGVALVSGVAAFTLSLYLSSGLTILFTGVAGALLGAWWTRDDVTLEENP